MELIQNVVIVMAVLGLPVVVANQGLQLFGRVLVLAERFTILRRTRYYNQPPKLTQTPPFRR